jgi:arabinose-5-phosphate isomerase
LGGQALGTPTLVRKLSPVEAPRKRDRVTIDAALRTLDLECEGLVALKSALADGLGQPFSRAVETLAGIRGRVIVTGIGKSGHVGQKIASTFASTGTPAFFVHPSEASHGDLGMIAKEDAVLAVSWSGETVELKNVITYSRRFAVPMIAITSNASSTLGSASDIVLELPKTKEACPHGLAPTTSTTMQLALGDRLAGGQRFHGARLQGAASGRIARRSAQVRLRHHA